MSESTTETPQPRRYRRFEPKEYRKAKRSERKQKAENKKIERKQALSALSQDKPEVADRIDLENLANVEANPERKLLNTEMTGVQAVFLLGGTMPETIDRPKIEAIARGEHVQTEKINRGSHSERDGYWNGEKSPYKDKTWNERMEIWTEKTNNFLSQYKGKPAEAFLKRMGVDLTNENQAKGIYDFYFAKGNGDIGLFASTIVENNTAEQIEENMEVIQKLGNIYGENSAKVAEQLVLGIKNAQTDTDLFIQSAQEEFKKGNNMPGIELINILDQKSSQLEKKPPTREHDQQDVNEPLAKSIGLEDKPDLANLEPPTIPPDADLNKQPEISTPRQEIINAEEVVHDASSDKWKGSGSLRMNGDYLSYLPEMKRRENPFAPGNKYYDNFERYGVDYDPEEFPYLFRKDMKKICGRRFKLAAVPDPEFIDPEVAKMTELKKVPDPIVWSILEANPDSADNKYQFKYGVEGDLGDSWNGVTVDKETLVNMQQKTLEYLETQVNAGEMPQAILDAAKGILRYSNSAPEDHHIKKLGTDQKTSGGNPEDPRVEMRWWKFFATDKWSIKGQLGQDENFLFYQDEKLKRQNRQRRIIIADSDPEDQTEQKLVLTKTAWDILRRGPSPVPGYVDSIGITDASGFASQSSEKPAQDKKGVWKAEAKTLSADSQTLGQMQRLIRSYVEKQVTDDRMGADMLAAVDGILKYKHGTLEPLRYEGDKLVYRIKGKEKPVVVERPPSLIDKIAEETENNQGLSQVEATPDEIKRYLSSKSLPAGASIRNLNFKFNGARATMTGFVNVPIPLVGGKINFNLELANNQNGEGVTVTNYSVDTKSGTLRSRLDQIEPYLKNINSFIADDINEGLQYSNKFLRVLGLSITPEGKFAIKVQNSVQAAA